MADFEARLPVLAFRLSGAVGIRHRSLFFSSFARWMPLSISEREERLWKPDERCARGFGVRSPCLVDARLLRSRTRLSNDGCGDDFRMDSVGSVDYPVAAVPAVAAPRSVTMPSYHHDAITVVIAIRATVRPNVGAGVSCGGRALRHSSLPKGSREHSLNRATSAAALPAQS